MHRALRLALAVRAAPHAVQFVQIQRALAAHAVSAAVRGHERGVLGHADGADGQRGGRRVPVLH